MNVIGIDPSLRRTGWAYIAWRGATRYWVCGTFRGDDHDAATEVLARAAQSGVTHAAIETVYLGRNFKTVTTLSEVIGSIKSWCWGAKIQTMDAPAMKWKSAMLTMGGCLPQGRKEQKAASMKVARMLMASPANNDEADAVCIAAWAQRMLETEARAIARVPKA